MSLRLVACPLSGNPQGQPGAQTRYQLALESAAPLDEQGLVDRLVVDTHERIIREVELESLGDLLRIPRQRPPPVLSTRLVQPLPRWYLGADDDRAVGSADTPGEPFLHVLA